MIAECGGYGINTSGSDRKNFRLDYNYLYNNASGNYNGYSGGDNDVILTGDPFVDSSTGDWNLNSTFGAGATLRASNYALNTDTSVYPFRQYVSDNFGGGGVNVIVIEE